MCGPFSLTMDFSKIPKVEDADSIISAALRKGRCKITQGRSKKGIAQIRKDHERALLLASASLQKKLGRILSSFPLKKVSAFYAELISNCLEGARLRKALWGLEWSVQKIGELEKKHLGMMRRARTAEAVGDARKAFLGRAGSIVRRADLAYLEKARFAMRKFPTLKEMYTVAICGYPNTGKSSLLIQLTGASPKVRDYAFTTQSLNLGYFGSIQVIDTPGAFNRPLTQMNQIEKQSYLTISHLADLVIFLKDPTMPQGEQELLCKRVQALGKKTVVVGAKADLGKCRSARLYVSAKTGEGIRQLKGLIKKHEAAGKKEYDKH